MTTRQHACLLSVTPEQLAALRDDMLPAAEAARLRAHAMNCPACRARMAEDDLLGRALRQPRPPDMVDTLWHSVLREHVRPSRRSLPAREVWLGAVITLALLVALLLVVPRLPGAGGRHPSTTISSGMPTNVAATATDAPTPVTTPTATPIAIPIRIITLSGPPLTGPHPTWQVYTLPTNFATWDANTSSFGVAPSDPAIAYACNSLGLVPGQTSRVIVTYDRGAHWASTTDPAGLTGECDNIVVDDDDPNVVIVGNLISFNGGGSWTPHGLGDPTYHHLYGHFASWQGSFYAINANHLVVSRDHMHTWQAIDRSITEPIADFQLNPANGAIAVTTTSTTTPPTYHVWVTQDGGQQWQHFAAPTAITDLTPIGQQGQWRFCGTTLAYSSQTTLAFICSDTMGKSWVEWPLTLDQGGGVDPIAVGNDGTLYAQAVSTQIDIYRLAPNATRWADLGPLPAPMESIMVYTQGGGSLWAFTSNVQGGKQIATAPIP